MNICLVFCMEFLFVVLWHLCLSLKHFVDLKIKNCVRMSAWCERVYTIYKHLPFISIYLFILCLFFFIFYWLIVFYCRLFIRSLDYTQMEYSTKLFAFFLLSYTIYVIMIRWTAKPNSIFVLFMYLFTLWDTWYLRYYNNNNNKLKLKKTFKWNNWWWTWLPMMKRS